MQKFDAIYELLTRPTQSRPRSQSQQEDLHRLNQMIKRKQQRQKRIKEQYTFHIVIDGFLPLFIVDVPQPNNPQPNIEIYQNIAEDESSVATNFYGASIPNNIPNLGIHYPPALLQNTPFNIKYHPFRLIKQYGVIQTGDKRTIINWRGVLPYEYQRIFKTEDRDVEWGQLNKNSKTQMLGNMNKTLIDVMEKFFCRHIESERLLECKLSNVYKQILANREIKILMASGSSSGLESLFGRVKMIIGFSKISDVTNFINQYRYDYFTFYQPGGKIGVFYRNPLNVRSTYEPILEINRSIFGTDLSIMLANYMDKSQI